MIFDPIYIVFVMLPAMLLGGWASWRVKSTAHKYSKVRASSGLTGAQAAWKMLQAAGLTGVDIERVSGYLSDHYDPRKKVLRLSPDVHDGKSLMAVGVACHEAGHAIQDARNYAPLVIRNAIVPTASIGSNLGLWLVIIGVILQAYALAWIGVALFGAVVFFQLVNLPVEFNASTRAKEMVSSLGIISGPAEAKGVDRVLSAAAMTYVAATIIALMQLLYFVWLIMGRRN